jgi:hypothetical protein
MTRRARNVPKGRRFLMIQQYTQLVMNNLIFHANTEISICGGSSKPSF